MVSKPAIKGAQGETNDSVSRHLVVYKGLKEFGHETTENRDQEGIPADWRGWQRSRQYHRGNAYGGPPCHVPGHQSLRSTSLLLSDARVSEQVFCPRVYPGNINPDRRQAAAPSRGRQNNSATFRVRRRSANGLKLQGEMLLNNLLFLPHWERFFFSPRLPAKI